MTQDERPKRSGGLGGVLSAKSANPEPVPPPDTVPAAAAFSRGSRWSADGKHRQNVTITTSAQDQLAELESWLRKLRNRGMVPKTGEKIGISAISMIGFAALDELRRVDEHRAIEIARKILSE